MIDGLHAFLNFPLFGEYSDLAWAAVRAVTGLTSLFVAWNMRGQRDKLRWLLMALGGWIALKVFDDVAHPSVGPQLTVYFAFSNLLWTLILLQKSRKEFQREYT